MFNKSFIHAGHYITDLLTDEATTIIKKHDKSRPLFLYLSHLAMHSANPYHPLQAPDEDIQKFPYIEDLDRKTVAGNKNNLANIP